MLPDSEDTPATFAKDFPNLLVPLDVSIQFLLPKRDVALRNAPVPRAPMPKATIYEDRNSLGAKYKIRLAWQGDAAAPA